MLVFGTRPEAIKMAPLVHKLKAEPEIFNVQVCVTAQHRQMLDQVLRIFDIVPDIDLDVMKPGQDLFDVTANVLQAMKGVFDKNKPDAVLVHGDTTTTLATAMAGFYAGVPVGHVEAGLRTHNLYAPFPEEFNRQVASRVTRWHFAPTELSRANLIAERVDDEDITVTGNTVIDALYWVLNRIDADGDRSAKLTQSLNQTLPFNWQSGRFVLITGHRRENFGDGFLQICEALRELAFKFDDLHFVYPVHLNPNVQKPVRTILEDFSNVHLVEPLDYEPFVYLLKHSYVVLTDSGGIQEEAPSLGKPVLVMRDVTERPEAVDAGTVELVGANKERIIAGVSRLLEDEAHYLKMSYAHNPYGDGRACDRILAVLRNI
ncbi:UDP-N-acetylglucosamine 2-epimerase (non-hydrolyzing) [Polynucleobacter sp. MWH-Spelu-300-X4]|nr:UDP-N-acetylglucosamine 2-epimerase (non-hydrolyzing) [Polynucleobacter sp. MWH-Spelu-300-X4]